MGDDNFFPPISFQVGKLAEGLHVKEAKPEHHLVQNKTKVRNRCKSLVDKRSVDVTLTKREYIERCFDVFSLLWQCSLLIHLKGDKKPTKAIALPVKSTIPLPPNAIFDYWSLGTYVTETEFSYLA